MAHTFDVSLYNTGAGQPQAFDFTAGAGATLLVLGVANAATVRAGGVPTYGGIPMIPINTETYDPGEFVVQLYYLTNPSTGSAYSISIPNTGTARTLYNRAVSFKAQTGYTSIYDASAWNGGAGANSSTNIAVTAGGVAVQIVGHGSASLPTAYSDLPILPVDHGQLTSWMQYKLPTSSATVSMWNTIGADDWGLIIGAWKEEALPPSVPSAPTLDYPITNTVIGTIDPSFGWQKGAVNASTWWIQVDNDSNFSSLVVDVSGLDVSTYTKTGLDYNTKYYWRVAGTNAGGTGSWSTTSDFSTYTVPGAPTLSYPKDGSIGIVRNPSLNWEATATATSYWVQLDNAGTFTNLLKDVSGITDIYYDITPDLSANTQYFWRAAATNAAGTGSWSAVWDFSTLDLRPAAPTLYLPESETPWLNQGVQWNSLSFLFDWSTVSDASSYAIQISTDADYSSLFYDSSGIIDTSIFIEDFVNFEMYYIRIASINPYGQGSWNAGIGRTLSFWNVVLTTPTNNATDVPIDVSFNWVGNTGIYPNARWFFYLWDVSDFNTEPLFVSDPLTTQYYTYDLSENTQYWWGIEEYPTADLTPPSGFSDVWKFTTGQGGDFIDGSANGSSVLSGTLTGLGTLNGSTNGLTTLSVFLQGLSPINGSTNGLSTLSATVYGTGVLNGSTNGLTTLSGTLYGTGPINGSTNGLSTLSGTLYGTGFLEGSTNGLTTLSATLDVAGSTEQIEGSTNGLTTLSGTLYGLGYLNGSTNGLTTLSSTVYGLGTLNGSTNGLSTVSSTITGLGTLNGSTNGLTTLSSTVYGLGLLNGSTNGLSTLAGAIYGLGALNGSTNGLSTLSSTLLGLGALNGSTNGLTTLSATVTDIVGIFQISGSTNGLTTLSSTVYGLGSLEGSTNGYSILSATVEAQSATEQIDGSTNGLTTLIATLTGLGLLNGSTNGLTTLSSTVYGLSSIEGSTNGLSILSSGIYGIGALNGSTNGLSELSATLYGTGSFDGSANGLTTLSATVYNSSPGLSFIEGSTNGYSILTATLLGIGNISGNSRTEYIVYENVYVNQFISASIENEIVSGIVGINNITGRVSSTSINAQINLDE